MALFSPSEKFVLNLYPDARIKRSPEGMYKQPMFAIYTPKASISKFWKLTEGCAWKHAQESIELEMLEKFES